MTFALQWSYSILRLKSSRFLLKLYLRSNLRFYSGSRWPLHVDAFRQHLSAEYRGPHCCPQRRARTTPAGRAHSIQRRSAVPDTRKVNRIGVTAGLG